MAREINPVCDFIFGSIYMCLLTDMMDVGLTIMMVKGIYTYCKDHTVESMIFFQWSESDSLPFFGMKDSGI